MFDDVHIYTNRGIYIILHCDKMWVCTKGLLGPPNSVTQYTTTHVYTCLHEYVNVHINIKIHTYITCFTMYIFIPIQIYMYIYIYIYMYYIAIRCECAFIGSWALHASLPPGQPVGPSRRCRSLCKYGSNRWWWWWC
jgi:hypothetical protein